MVLKENGWADPQKLDPVQRLIDNGILMEKTAGGFSRLRFVLDPIPENLAAAHCARMCRRDAECLKNLRATLPRRLVSWLRWSYSEAMCLEA